jgi:hypothetical protein
MKTWMKVASLALALMLIFGTIGVSSVQAQGNGGNGPSVRLPIMRALLQSVLTAVEKATKLDRAAIEKELQGGKTLSQIITDHGGNVDAVKADAKADLEAKAKQAVTDGFLSQAQADRLLANVDQALTNAMDFKIPTVLDRINAQLQGLEYLALVRETASQTDGTARTILMQLRDGKTTLADIAAKAKVDTGKIVDAVVTKITDRINEMVKNERLTADQAKPLIDGLKESLTKLMNNPAPTPQFGRMGRGGKGGFGKGNKGIPESAATATP